MVRLPRRVDSALVFRPVRQTWWSLPARLLRVVLDARWAKPAPWIYWAAAALGVALGVALDAFLGWPWWLPAMAVVAVVWSIFAATAFVGGPPRRRSLRDALLDEIDPAGSVERHVRHMEASIRSAPFALYGLPAAWRGRRWIGGGAWDERLAMVELGHGAWSPAEGERLVVRAAARSYVDTAADDVLEDVWQDAGAPPQTLSPEAFDEWREARRRALARRIRRTRAAIDVDGRAAVFEILEDGDRWVARALVAETLVTIVARGFPREGVALEVVTDVSPYLEGYRASMKNLFDPGAMEDPT